MIIDWISGHWIELLGTFFAFLYLYLSVRENIWLWVTGFVSSFLYLVLFLDERLYADMSLQVYYLIISVYGWFAWTSGRKASGRPKMPVSCVNRSLALKLLLAGAGIYGVVIIALLTLPEQLGIPTSDLPYWDAFTTTGGIVATWMLARKKLEHWLIWVVVDLVSTGMYIYKGLTVTVVLYIVYTLVAVVGFREWKQQMMVRDHDEHQRMQLI
ncbi:nicotinamide mononucleotide transporter [Marinilabilia salmonicolor]|jgi:nicotinamide mononucleotide transporter|uniref:nicotinamide riboside transporter PnuC n=1 Tax=Marinilabilia salmonicolor TaxID=989 RepID=UPI000D0749CA|nr:nicotinamide riboside transporter PnuC [Marinilabilia salmonicolor]PRY96003.1 nicotinamide mononucleotide transporter [Marinilabilia salmonicolor]